ncbi:5-carboxymethyl-2-hydroxymuconate Delta-isomerase [Thalassotalea euphylliae]|uniref:5-carboxymethyl-2-hydroxymuconate Delta-isomerase n=1 Tax=Thalassotalea euphylliae TaxID=1655234 RepID=UPI001C6DDEBE|nr:5-carboxymethyl-2-hydroxymuconate Delta-isomerase [Thalassotalea euphylliae]
MPHFVIECSENITELVEEAELNQAIYEVAAASELFTLGDIKVRTHAYQTYLVGGSEKDDFVHVFASIMQGRSDKQKATLSTESSNDYVSYCPASTISP